MLLQRCGLCKVRFSLIKEPEVMPIEHIGRVAQEWQHIHAEEAQNRNAYHDISG